MPESRTYFIHSISPDSNSLIVYIPIHDNKYWTYTLIRDTGSLKTGANSLLPTNFIYRAYPNPFNPTINIYYELPIKDMVKIDIVNIVGQKIKTLTNKIHEPGKHSYLWGGKTTAGKEIQSGIYFAIITTSSKREVLKITYLK